MPTSVRLPIPKSAGAFVVVLFVAVLLGINPSATQAQGSQFCAALATAGAPVTGLSETDCALLLTRLVQDETSTYWNLFNPFPLEGREYPAYDLRGQLAPYGYDVRVEADGTYHQPALPAEGERVAHQVSLEFPPGEYTFSGVSCDLHLDLQHNGRGSANPITLGRGNGLPFTVTWPVGVTDPNWLAWSIVVCNDGGANDVVGFSIRPVVPGDAPR